MNPQAPHTASSAVSRDVPPFVSDAALGNSIRFLSMDAVQAANSGHPGMPMGMAEIAVALWTKHLRHNPANPHWARAQGQNMSVARRPGISRAA